MFNLNKLWMIILLLISGSVYNCIGQENKTDEVIRLTLPYEIKLDKLNERTSSRVVLVHLNEDYFDMCNLKMIFSQIERNFPSRNLEIGIYTDVETVEQMTKYTQNSGVPFIDTSTSEGKEALLNYYQKKYPKIKGSIATYYRIINDESAEKYIDYTVTKDSNRFKRIKVL